MGEPIEQGCPECNGATVEFRGRGKDVQYRVCSQWQQPGHKTRKEISSAISAVMRAHCPVSGRFA